MYYPKSKVIFPHIAKTGGSSLEYFIGQVEHPVLFETKYKNVKNHMKFLNDLYQRYTLEEPTKRWSIHRPAKKYFKQLGEDVYDSCYSFSFIRNPFSQIKSLYTMNRADMEKRGKSFPEWDNYIWDVWKGPCLETHKIFLDQKGILSNDDGELLVNEIFPFEYYQDAVTLLGRKLKFEPDFGVRLWSTKPKYEFTPDMVERVMDLYGDSYELWKEVKTHWEKTNTPYEARTKSSDSNPS